MAKKTNKAGGAAVKLGIIGAGLAGLAATYFFLGPKGKKHQKHAKAWAIRMKGDVVGKLEAVRDVSKPVYHEIIDSVASEYKRGMEAGREEITALAGDLKKHWKTLSRGAGTVKNDVMKGASRVAKKAGL